MNELKLGKIAGSAAIIKDKKVLLLKRSENSSLFPSHWTFPSGGIETTDIHVQATVTREVKEETGLDFTPKNKFNFYESQADGKRHFALVFTGEVNGDINLDNNEVKEFAFYTYEETTKLPLAFAYKDVINDLNSCGLIA